MDIYNTLRAFYKEHKYRLGIALILIGLGMCSTCSPTPFDHKWVKVTIKEGKKHGYPKLGQSFGPNESLEVCYVFTESMIEEWLDDNGQPINDQWDWLKLYGLNWSLNPHYKSAYVVYRWNPIEGYFEGAFYWHIDYDYDQAFFGGQNEGWSEAGDPDWTVPMFTFMPGDTITTFIRHGVEIENPVYGTPTGLWNYNVVSFEAWTPTDTVRHDIAFNDLTRNAVRENSKPSGPYHGGSLPARHELVFYRFVNDKD